MSFSPENFLTHIKRNNGIATGNRYEVTFGTIPTKSSLNQDAKGVTMLCHTASILGKAINANTEIYGYGSEYNLPVNEGFEDLSLSFHTTYGTNKTLPERKYFDEWMNVVINPTTNQAGFKKEFAADIDVYLLNSQGKKCYHQRFLKAFPLTISNLELSGGATELLSFDVTFTYDNWLSNDDI